MNESSDISAALSKQLSNGLLRELRAFAIGFGKLSPHDADDAVQTTFVRFLSPQAARSKRVWCEADAPDIIRPVLFGTLKNVIREEWRARKRRPITADFEGEFAGDVTDRRASCDVDIKDIFPLLAERERDVITLMHIGFDDDEIAQRCSLNTVSVRVIRHRAVRRLRRAKVLLLRDAQ